MKIHEPTAFYSINTTVLQHEGFSETVIKHIAHAFHILYKVNTSTEDALRRIEEQVPSSPEIVHLIEFVRSCLLYTSCTPSLASAAFFSV